MRTERLFLAVLLVLSGLYSHADNHALKLTTLLFRLDCSTMTSSPDICVSGLPVDGSLGFDFFEANESRSLDIVLEDAVAIEKGDSIELSMDNGYSRVSREFHLEEAKEENFVIEVKVGIYDDQGNSTSLETGALLSVNGAKRYVYFRNLSMDAGKSGKPVLEMMLIGLEDL